MREISAVKDGIEKKVSDSFKFFKSKPASSKPDRSKNRNINVKNHGSDSGSQSKTSSPDYIYASLDGSPPSRKEMLSMRKLPALEKIKTIKLLLEVLAYLHVKNLNINPGGKQADFFALGIIVAEILTTSSTKITPSNMIENFRCYSNALLQVPLSEIYQSLPEIFQGVHIEKFYLDKNMSEIDLNTHIFHQLSRLAVSLSRKNPAERLKNSSLEEEIAKLDHLLEEVEEWQPQEEERFDKKESATFSITNTNLMCFSYFLSTESTMNKNLYPESIPYLTSVSI